MRLLAESTIVKQDADSQRALDAVTKLAENLGMPRWCNWLVCIVLAMLVALICIVPGWHLYPVTLRFEALVFALLLFLSSICCASVEVRDVIVLFVSGSTMRSHDGVSRCLSALRC